MIDLNELNEKLISRIKPLTYPLAVKMLGSLEEIPSNVKFKTAEQAFGDRTILCTSIRAARTYGWVIAAGKSDNVCPMANICFGFTPDDAPWFVEGKYQFPIQKTRQEDRARERKLYPRFEYGKYRNILFVPLFRAQSVFQDGFEPDVIMLHGMPGQVIVLSEGLPHGELQAQASGGECVGSILKTIQTGKPHVVMPCPGERIIAYTQDFECVFSMPLNKVELVMERLEETYNAGHRYPIPILITSDFDKFPPPYQQIMTELDKYTKEYDKKMAEGHEE